MNGDPYSMQINKSDRIVDGDELGAVRERASIWTSWIISGTPSITSSRVRSVVP